MKKQELISSRDFYNRKYGKNITTEQKRSDWITVNAHDTYGNVQSANVEMKRGRLHISAASSELAELLSWWG